MHFEADFVSRALWLIESASLANSASETTPGLGLLTIILLSN
jgi:hypothetical protein